ncbi:hypothetical protein CDD81_4162 [Ophiocordyceps australis]|uniref:MARVEL domain-containing protein n=1 Tax=Ophiocordyceps australis TaxID=1399860 RepID=A0A2C5XR39_9HYPO|nr:hypothetical protein CDD81_4162 [Ophiocordyceps australis]
MGAKSGLALKTLQWSIRLIQFLCAAIILGIFSYFLATLNNHSLHISTGLRAVEGISGAAVVYTLAALILVCCIAGFTLTAALAILLDLCFAGAFIYVAVNNRNGASSCRGYLDTPFGKGNDGEVTEGSSGFTALPSYHTACRLQTACLAVAIVGVIFFILSAMVEFALARHHQKEKRFGPSPANNYTSGYSPGLFSRFRRKRTNTDDANALPEHTHPDQLDPSRPSEATEATIVNSGTSGPDHAKVETGYGYGYGHQHHPAFSNHTDHANAPVTAGYVPQQPLGAWHTAPHTNAQPSAPYRYTDGVYDRA